MKNQNKFYSTIIHTPLGLMKIEADECCLLSVDFTEDEIGGPENNVSKEGARVIASYFKGKTGDGFTHSACSDTLQRKSLQGDEKNSLWRSAKLF